MSWIASIPLVCSILLAAGAAAGVGRRSAPRAAATVLVAASLTAAVAIDAALGALVGARLLDAAPLASLLHWRSERPGPIPVPVPLSATAAFGLAAVVVAAGLDFLRTRRAARLLRATREASPAGELVVVRSAELVAYAVPGDRKRAGQIVVSDSLLRALEPAERRVVLAHERSHLRHRHDRYRRLIRVAARINPLLRPTVRATDFLLERWADEDAAREVGSRIVAARALARAALARSPSRLGHATAGFATHGVSTRVDALLAGPPRRMPEPALVLSATLALGSAVGAAASLHALAQLFEVLRG
jgi:Peptidase family M48